MGKVNKMKKTLEKMSKAGFKYVKRYYFDTKLEVYERPKDTIIYNPKNDEIVMQTGYIKNDKGNF